VVFIINDIKLYVLDKTNNFQSLKDYKENILNNLYNIYNSKDIMKLSNFGYSYLDGKKYIFYHPIFIFKSKYINKDEIKMDLKFKKQYKRILSFISNEKTNDFYEYCLFSGNTFLFFTKFIVLFKYNNEKIDITKFKDEIYNIVNKYFKHQLNETFIINHLLITNKSFTYLGYSKITNRDIFPVTLNILDNRTIDNLLEYNKIKDIFKPKQLREFILNNLYDIKIFIKFEGKK
jgi:hypothetical protein